MSNKNIYKRHCTIQARTEAMVQQCSLQGKCQSKELDYVKNLDDLQEDCISEIPPHLTSPYVILMLY